ncbi:CTCF [Mytilus coruscus]|uniref:CTCF n=1 Tax=Mytilus coruscus TaxID=42192 RepID=A0A6J8CJP6_MYTCO|nr:CTCF [Mytilus coruscus]
MLFCWCFEQLLVINDNQTPAGDIKHYEGGADHQGGAVLKLLQRPPKNDMDSLEVNSIKQDLNEQDTELTSGDGCSKLADNSNLVADSQNHDDDSDLKHLVDDRESPVIIRDETIVQLQNHGPNVPTSIQSSPDQLNDLQSYLVTFNKEIGHGGQPTGYSIGEIHVDTSNLQSSARPVLYSDGQIINVSTSLHSSQGLSSISDDSKVEISMTTDNLDPQSQTLKLAEALSNSGALLQQSDSVISQSVLSPLSHSPDQQRTVVLQGLPGAPGTLVQVNVPGKKVLPVVSLDGKEQMQVSMDSMTTVIPQIIHVSQPSEILQTGIEAMKTDVITTVASNSAGMGSLQGIQIGQADITNAQLIALQNAENANTQLVTVNTPQEIQLMGTSDTETGSSTNFQTVSIVPTSVDQGGEMNYVLIVSQPDGEKEGGSPKQFALDMGMFQPVFDFKDGQNMVEEVVDDDGTTRKIIRCEYAALSQRHLESHLLTHTGEKPFECDECEQTFRQKQLLKRHKNLYHTPDYSRPEPKEKTYECNSCDKSFANKGNLLRHMQNHDPEYWNKKLGDGGNVALSTEDLIQGSLLNDMREGKLGSAPKVVIVHPNGSVEEVTNRLQNLVAEKQMEEMMVEVVQDGSSPTAVSTHSLEEAIRSQVEAAIQSHALKALEIAKTNSGDDSATDNLTIDLDRPTHTVTGQPKQTFSRQELEMETESSPGSNNGCITLGTSQTGWDTEHMNKVPDHIVIVKPKDKRGVLKIVSETNQDIDESKESKGGLIGGVGIDEDNISADLNDQSVLPVQLDHEMENGDNTQS